MSAQSTIVTLRCSSVLAVLLLTGCAHAPPDPVTALDITRLTEPLQVDGYAVEGFLPAAALHAMGVRSWGPGSQFHLGLYRADFRPEAPDDPTWLT